ncbi:MAG TPA: hypothetical protein VMP01_26420 [Pirellulaceae bacterium]|nr:hypothetical protein [Pirellulaceae bacterium]
MGQLRFAIPRPERLSPGAMTRAYVAGIDGIPWECRRTNADGVLSIERDVRESGNLYFPWLVPGQGEYTLCTASLMERERSYHLTVELARGTLNRLRNQIDIWESGGATIPDECRSLVHESTLALARAAIGKEDAAAADEAAGESIELAMRAIDLLCRDYSRQVLEIRRREQPMMSMLLGCRLDHVPTGEAAEAFTAAFNTAVIVPNWRDLSVRVGEYEWDLLDEQVQWCRDQGLRVCMGPVVQFDRSSLPDWLYLWEEEFDELEASVVDFARAVVQRYLGRVHLWNCAGRMNVPGVMDLSEEQRLRLTVDLLELVRSIDPRTPTIVSFDQPWAEYVADEEQELTPLHFADTLARSDLGLAGVAMEMNFGYLGGGTLPRDALEISRQIDRWGQLGVPLVGVVTLPSRGDDDPSASSKATVLPSLAAGGVTPKWQCEQAQGLIPLLVARQPMQAVFWNQLRDNVPHDFPHGGLYDAAGKPKPVLAAIIDMRKELMP